MPRAKIVCTLGPASASPERIGELIEAGMNVARLNFSHGSHEDHARMLQVVRSEADKRGRAIAALLDLQGPKIRVGKFEKGQIELKPGAEFTITTDASVIGDEKRVSTTYSQLPMDVRPGDQILLDDGYLALAVTEVADREVKTIVVAGGTLKNNKGINLPGVALRADALTAKDREDLIFGLKNGVDMVALSFVRTPEDIEICREAMREAGYAIVRRRWQAGDMVSMTLPMDLRIEATTDDPDTIAILRGPLVLAADLGPADKELATAAAPALVGSDILGGFRADAAQPAVYRTEGLGRPADMRFAPFYSAYDRRSAVYFKRFTDAGWEKEKVAFAAEQARLADLAARSVDVMHLGEMQPERDHGLTSDISYPVVYRGRNGRDARSGGFFQFSMKVKPGPLVLEATYWGDERKRAFDILIDGQKIATQELEALKPGQFIDIDYPVPEALTHGKASVVVRFQPHTGHTAGPVFGVRLFTPAKGATV